MAEVLIHDDAQAAGETGARLIARTLRDRPASVLGVATGGTPLHVYRALRAEVAKGLSFEDSSAFALDEYIGLPPGHPESYREVLLRELLPLGFARESVHTPDADPDGLPTAAERYERAIEAAGGVDIQILGIGTDGHIGFNEPGSSLGSLTRLKTLSAQTRSDNARFFGGDADAVPVLCLTQGIGTILRARCLLLLAFGEGKAAAVSAALEGPISASCPGSAIQLHPNVVVLVDEAAASGLRLREYYRSAQDARPPWQVI